ncbi:MAG TPA: Pvc16 family protein [candidate division Zixibacteria bacterium]|nr:Pvc16 family protein [candidate division Zixibacteria bacterium]
MIADLDESIKRLLIEDMPIKNGEIDIKFDQPKREWSAKLTKPTINFFLYDLRENVQLRQTEFHKMSNGNSSQNIAQMKKTPHRLDCYYMLTTWAAEAEDEHRLMTRTLMSLFRNPILPEHLLQGTLRNPQFPISTFVARHDKLTNPAEVWSALDNEMRPTVAYTTTIALDPWTEVTGPIVRTLTLRAGETSTLPVYRRLDESRIDYNFTYIGGTVRDKAKDFEPVSGLSVAIKGTGLFDTTDDSGRFTLGGMPEGDYTLVVWPPKGKPKEKKISIPADDGDYDVDL